MIATSRLALALLVGALASAALLPGASTGQERLIDQEPHDLLTIPDGKETKTVKIDLLKLPNRRVPKDVKPSDKLRVRLMEDTENRDFEVQWRDVKRLELWEERVLGDAMALAAVQKFDEAYENFDYLLKNHPQTSGLDAAIQSYWYLSAGAAFQEKRYDEALAVMEELLRRNPNYKHTEGAPSLMSRLGNIVDKLVQGYLDKGDFGAARKIVVRIARDYPDSKNEPFYSRYESRVREAAEKKRDEAREHLAAKRYTEAYDATAAMLDIWPDVGGARELAVEMSEQYPLAVIGVEQFAKEPGALRIDRWADFRAGRLTDRRLIELRGIGPEGGTYACPIGTCERSEDGRSLTLSLKPGGSIGAFDVLQMLLDGARTKSSLFSPEWAQVLGMARIVKAGQVEAMLRRSHVLPQALLPFPLSVPAEGKPAGAAWPSAFVMQPPERTRSRFVLPPDVVSASGSPREIQERIFADPEAALLAIERGEIDALDRIHPGDVERVQAMPGVKVVRYAVPTVHVLLPNPDRVWPASRTFRRAVMHGTQREATLQQGVLRGAKSAGAQLLSGPFPAPIGENDPLSYAYDPDVKPHAFEPLLSVTLFTIAKREQESLAMEKGEEPPKFQGIVLGHQPRELHRVACVAMAKQLSAIGIPASTLELGSADAAKQCDFVYAELLIAEPVIDAGRLFGPTGLAPATNSHVRLGVRQVEEATTWNQAGARLRLLHRTLREELTVLPLWQTPEHFAFRQSITGISPAPVTLYQDIDSWQVKPRLGQN